MKKRVFVFVVLLCLVLLLTISFVSAKYYEKEYRYEGKIVYGKTTVEKWKDYWEARKIDYKRKAIKIKFIDKEGNYKYYYPYEKKDYKYGFSKKYYDKDDWRYKIDWVKKKDYGYKKYKNKPVGWIRKKRICKDAAYYLGKHGCK